MYQDAIRSVKHTIAKPILTNFLYEMRKRRLYAIENGFGLVAYRSVNFTTNLYDPGIER
jgi:hypothetical protein